MAEDEDGGLVGTCENRADEELEMCRFFFVPDGIVNMSDRL